MSITQRIRILKEEIEMACSQVKRNPEEVLVVAVTKTVGCESIEKAYRAGIKFFGENRVQEARKKIPLLQHLKDVEWHLIGHLQKNKVKYAVNLFDMIQSIDSQALASEIEKRVDRKINVLIEVNTTGEPQKHGILPEYVFNLVERVLDLEKLNFKGFMTVGPYPVEEKKSRKAFALLREIRDKAEEDFKIRFPILSMGMTEDFHYAILEGSTMIRIGRGIFGERQ